MEIVCESLFAVPFWKTQLTLDNDKFLNYLKQIVSSLSLNLNDKWCGPGSVEDHFSLKIKNNKPYYSTASNLVCNSRIVDSLLKEVDFVLNTIGESIGVFKNNYLKVSEFWFNYQKGQSFSDPHIHERSLLSAVYYPLAPSGCCNFMITNVSQLQTYFWSLFINEDDEKLLSQTQSSLTLTRPALTFTPQTGDLIIFPSFLEHYIEPTLDANSPERLSIAFNSALTS
jgi:uncharacterized protein (TIGR02466 family)